MKNPCDICIEESCNGKYNCDCKNCKVAVECPKFLHATIRITNKCTQECSHCCFESSPSSKIMMSIEMARKISKFLSNNDIVSLNLMGGEFFCNPNWFEIFDSFLGVTKSVRIVSNGDWANSDNVKDKIRKLHEIRGDKFRIHISKDKWHTNINVDKAIEFLNDVGINSKITSPNESTDNSIVPIGRSEYLYNFYSSLGCYCHNPLHKYSFLIDEEGKIYKCSFGVWNYANISDYLDGGFRSKFKEFNKKFHEIFIPSCKSCIRSSDIYEGNNVKRE